MSSRNRGPPHPMKGIPHGSVYEPPYARGLGPMLHPALLEELRESQMGRGPGRLPPHPAIIEERLAVQHEDIQGLLVDNQRLAATHVALKQELEAAQYELQRMLKLSDSLRAEKDVQMRELYEKSMRMEMDLRAVEATRAESVQVNVNIKDLTGARQELTSQVQVMSQDLARMNSDLQQVPALRADIENMKQEVQRVRAAIDFEKKGSAENYEHGQAMEQKLISMARELEKLRAEIANTEKRARATTTVNPGAAAAAYTAPYGNPEAGYGANPYPTNYGMNPVQASAEGYAQYGHGAAAWGAFDKHRAQGHR